MSCFFGGIVFDGECEGFMVFMIYVSLCDVCCFSWL